MPDSKLVLATQGTGQPLRLQSHLERGHMTRLRQQWSTQPFKPRFNHNFSQGVPQASLPQVKGYKKTADSVKGD